MSDDIKRCGNCNARVINYYNNEVELCNHCYYLSEIYECSECGREITMFEIDFNNGECYICNPDCD